MEEPPQMTQSPAVPDEILAKRIRAGDSNAGDELVHRYARPLLAYLSRLTGSVSLAEDIHQQTWLSVLEHIDRFDGTPGGFKSWLFRIATNKVNDLWRSRARQRSAENNLRLVGEEEVADASQRLESVEVDRKLRQAIERLPEAQREVVCMRYFADMKFVEIAQTLGCPLNTALGRMHKALLKLREALGE